MIDKNRIPQHIAIIMDGNGRWAMERGKVRTVSYPVCFLYGELEQAAGGSGSPDDIGAYQSDRGVV